MAVFQERSAVSEYEIHASLNIAVFQILFPMM